MKVLSINNYILCKSPDSVRKLEAEVTKGFATVKQKSGYVGLTVVTEARLGDGMIIPVGSIVYLSEEYLYSAKKKTMTSDVHPEGCIQVLSNEVIFVKTEE